MVFDLDPGEGADASRSGSKTCQRLNAAARCMAVYQQGLLALKVRRNGQQRIMVQYVNVSNSSQAVIGNVERDKIERRKTFEP